jgi:predicted nucleic acid-binding protein
MRVALDSDILVYAEVEPDSVRGQRSHQLIVGAGRDGVIPMQALGELLRFMQRKFPSSVAETVEKITRLRATYLCPHATDQSWAMAMQWSLAHKLQFWDALICAVALNAGAQVLLSEDMQDGRSLDGLRILNTFADANAGFVAALIGNEGRH